MSLETTASNKGKGNLDLIDRSIQENISAALRFKRLAIISPEKAGKYYKHLPHNAQEYVRYSQISQSFYNKLYDEGLTKHDRNI